MTEQPDTAALRAFYAPGAGHGPLVERDIRVLSDALDGARDELRIHQALCLDHVAKARAKAAEARIGKALALCDANDWCQECAVAPEIRRALTEGTGQ